MRSDDTTLFCAPHRLHKVRLFVISLGRIKSIPVQEPWCGARVRGVGCRVKTQGWVVANREPRMELLTRAVRSQRMDNRGDTKQCQNADNGAKNETGDCLFLSPLGFWLSLYFA